jgi:hypothetical protein
VHSRGLARKRQGVSVRLKVKNIRFDFEDGGRYLPRKKQDAVVRAVIGKVYEVEDEDFLADAISDDTGWCIYELDYEVVK